MKIFLSHQRADSAQADTIRLYLKTFHNIDCYLDVVDPVMGKKQGPELAEHVRRQLAECDSLLAVVSTATSKSSWVPWEIGIATEKSLPLATYTESRYNLPEFLQAWPYLQSKLDLNLYANELTKISQKRSELSESIGLESFNESMETTVRDFYRNLKIDLGH